MNLADQIGRLMPAVVLHIEHGLKRAIVAAAPAITACSWPSTSILMSWQAGSRMLSMLPSDRFAALSVSAVPPKFPG